jgi:hypothetical protein
LIDPEPDDDDDDEGGVEGTLLEDAATYDDGDTATVAFVVNTSRGFALSSTTIHTSRTDEGQSGTGQWTDRNLFLVGGKLLDRKNERTRTTVKWALGVEHIGPTCGKAGQTCTHEQWDGFDNLYLEPYPEQSVAAAAAASARHGVTGPGGTYVSAQASALVSLGGTCRAEGVGSVEAGWRSDYLSVSAFAGASARSIGHDFVRKSTVNPTGEIYAGASIGVRVANMVSDLAVWGDGPNPAQNPNIRFMLGIRF